jgi:cytochrome c-type biogenesis protein
MSQYLEAFLLGNAAIIGNVCVLPLYPGLLAFLAGQHQSPGAAKPAAQTGWLGVLVLAGVLSLMLVLGGVLYALRQSVTTILPVLLPVAYGAVFVLGILLLFGINPFKHLASMQSPILQNRYATAYLYGLLLGPMTLPCTGPLIISAFVLGAGDALALADGIAYFLAFGLGFGWPLVALALVAAHTGAQLTRWFARREPIIQRLSGILLIAIALFGLQTDVLPNLRFVATPNVLSDAVAGIAALAASPTVRPTRVAGSPAPEIAGITNWINSTPLTIADLQGQVVLIHF